MLCRQGRMHPKVALFANRAFYGGHLIPVGLPHQTESPDSQQCFVIDSRLLRFLQDNGRKLFMITDQDKLIYPSQPEKAGGSAKINYSEARIVAGLAAQIYESHRTDFDDSRTLGVITPYRSQIALIKKEIEALGIPALNRKN